MEDDIKKLLAENVAVSKEIRDILFKINRYFLWVKVKGIVYLFIFVILPLLFSYLYLPTIIQDYKTKYFDLFANSLLQSKNQNTVDISKLIELLKQSNTSKSGKSKK